MSTSATQSEHANARRWLPWLIGIVAFGVLVRSVLLLLARKIEPFADESNYLYLALVWNRFGVYTDAGLYLWPPGYPALLAAFLHFFGANGVFAAKLAQVLLAGVVGTFTMLIGRRLFDVRVALIAGLIWCFYLPLVGFTHYLWPETLFLALFLPGLYGMLLWWSRTSASHPVRGLLVVSGLLIGVALLVKEILLWWCPLVALLIGLHAWRRRALAAVADGLLFLLAVAVVVLPWTLRNYDVYGRFVPVGATLGQNLYLGVNPRYRNFDYPPQMWQEVSQANATVQRWLLSSAAKAWERPAAHDVVALDKAVTARAWQFASDNPGFVLRSRIKSAADWATPLSFFVRHFGLQRYNGLLAGAALRRVLIVLALLGPLLVLVCAQPGIALLRGGESGRVLLLVTLCYLVATGALINGLSRYRTPVIPLLIVLAAAFLSRPRDFLARPRRWWIYCGCAWLTLVVLWAINAAEIQLVLQRIW